MFSIFKKVKLEIVDKSQLVDGTEIVSDTAGFGIGSQVFVIASDGTSIALPDGEYTFEDGTVLQVVSGKVTDKILPEVKEEAPIEEVVEAAIEEKVETPEEEGVEKPEDVVKEEADYQKMIDDLIVRIAALEDAISNMGMKAEELKEENTKLSQVVLELSDEPAVASVSAISTDKKEINDIDARVAIIRELREKRNNK